MDPKHLILLGAAGLLALAPAGGAQEGPVPFVIDEFDPDVGTLVSVGFDSATDTVWIYNSLGDDLLGYSTTGAFLGSIPAPGEDSNDADIDFASDSFTLDMTLVPEGSLLFGNGEIDTAEIYAVDPVTGAEIATLATAFGNDHVVGAAYHPTRGTFFLLTDVIDSVNPSTVAEIDPLTGLVLGSTFRTDVHDDYDVNFGDVDVDAFTGNLLFVSQIEATILELTPTGDFVRAMPLPAGVTGMSGIALVDDALGEAYVTGIGGEVWHLGGLSAFIFVDGFESGDTSAWSSGIARAQSSKDQPIPTVTARPVWVSLPSTNSTYDPTTSTVENE